MVCLSSSNILQILYNDTFLKASRNLFYAHHTLSCFHRCIHVFLSQLSTCYAGAKHAEKFKYYLLGTFLYRILVWNHSPSPSKKLDFKWSELDWQCLNKKYSTLWDPGSQVLLIEKNLHLYDFVIWNAKAVNWLS